MKTTTVPKYILRQIVFWFLFFVLNRLIFLIHVNSQLPHNITFWQKLAPFWYGLYLDLSTVGYLLLIPFILLLPNLFFKIKITNKILFGYVCLMVFIIAVVVSADIPVFDEWGVKLSYKALKYLSHPSEIVNSASNFVLLRGSSLIALQTFVGIFAFKKWVYRDIEPIKVYWAVPYILILPGLLIIAIRGGFQQIPIQQSDAYYSKVNILDQAAVNSLWNIGQSIRENQDYLNHNPYQYFPIQQANEIVKQLYTVKKDSTIPVLTTTRPNIVLIIQEGWSSDLVGALGGYKGITPGFDSLCKQGLLFSNIYSTGYRSDQGMAAIFSAFPAQPKTSIITQASKYPHLPCIGKDFEKQGYETSYMFAGQLSYGNIKSYMVYNDFDHLIVGNDFPDSLHKSKLGVPDQYMYQKNMRVINKMKPPFFAACFTISPHAPYDIPVPYIFQWGGKDKGYLNAVHYADSCMFRFIQNAKKMPWYKNTLFIILSDHSHDSPKKWSFYSPNYVKMPLLFYGDVIKKDFRGKKISRLGSQIDLASTLLNQMDLPDTAYHWSKNLLNPFVQQFAYYSFDNGVGWVRPNGYFSWDHTLKRYYTKHFADSLTEKNEIKNGKAYLESVFQTYLNY